MKHNNIKLPIRWLLFAILVTAMVSSVTLSRYVTEVSGTGTAQVANVALGDVQLSFATDGSNADVDASNFGPGETLTYNFSVANKENGISSDVTLEYSIQVESTGNLPLTFALTSTTRTGNGTAISGWTKENQDNAKGNMPYGGKDRHNYTLTATWPANENKPDYANMVDLITVTVHAEQAQTAQ